MDIKSLEERHNTSIAFIGGLVSDAPAMGMLGTLVGLVAMLQNLSDPAAIGPGMAVALLTTFYGSYLANLLAGPCKNKLYVRSQEELINMSIIVSGILGIVAGENPRLIKEKLDCFLQPNKRTSIEEEEEEE
jgi:chemotaxis protein MotA